MKWFGYPCLAVLLALPVSAHAHPETGFLPDAIAETEYRIVLEITPNDNATRNKLGIVLYRKNKLQEASRQFTEVLKSAPRDFDAHDGLGLVRFKEKKYAEAASWSRQAIAINGEDTSVYHTFGQSLEQLGQLKEAEASYRKGLEVNARNIGKGANKTSETAKRDILQNALNNLRLRLKTAR
jgi:Flp pilus assembly protein TadD